MKVQEIETKLGKRYIVLDDDFKPVMEAVRFLKYLDSVGKSPNTQRAYALDLVLFFRYMLSIQMPFMELCSNADKGPVDILSSFIMWLQYPDYSKGLLHFGGEECARSNKTVNRIMSTVLEFYSYLASNNEIKQLECYKLQMSNSQLKPFLYELVKHKRQVMSSIFKKPVKGVPVEGVTRAEFNELFEACSNDRDKFLVALLFEGGLRVNEALGSHWSDFDDLQDGVFHIVARENNENGARVKRNAEGIIYLPKYVINLFMDYMNGSVLDYDSDFVFLNLYSTNAGKPLNSDNVEDLFERLSKKIGKRVHPHMLRHGFAQEKLESGWPLEQVQAYLRHKNPTSTQIYCSYTDAMKVAQIKNFYADHGVEILAGDDNV